MVLSRLSTYQQDQALLVDYQLWLQQILSDLKDLLSYEELD